MFKVEPKTRSSLALLAIAAVLATAFACGTEQGSGDTALKLNEIVAKSSSSPDWIELHNASDKEVSLEGFQLRDSNANWTFPAGAKIPARGFLQVLCDDSGYGGRTNFKLSAKGEQVTLLDKAGGVVDQVTYPTLLEDVAWGRLPDGIGDWGMLYDLTPGKPNARGAPAETTAPDSGTADSDDPTKRFSFFVTSLDAMRELSGSQDGFGGNLGGLSGADGICQKIAVKAGFGHKTWRAFLSVTKGPDGKPVNAIDRIGSGPWYDRNGRLVAKDKPGLLKERPEGDAQIINDLPDEHGRGLKQFGDNHDILTGSNAQGRLNSSDPTSTCQDWTSATGPGSEKKVMAGHAWPRTLGGRATDGGKLPDGGMGPPEGRGPPPDGMRPPPPTA